MRRLFYVNVFVICSIFVASSVSSYAQFDGHFFNPGGIDNLMESIRMNGGLGLGDLEFSDIQGSPFLSDEFMKGDIVTLDSTIYRDVMLRYDAYNETMQLKYSDKIYAVTSSSFNIVFIQLKDKRFVKLFYKEDNNLKGVYSEILYEGPVSLYARYNVKFNEATEAAAYVEPKPARFGALKVTYYVNNNTDLTPVAVGTKKQFLRNISDDGQVAQFIKKQKLKFTKQEDLIKIIEYYNSTL